MDDYSRQGTTYVHRIPTALSTHSTTKNGLGNLRSLKPAKASPSVKPRYCITCGTQSFMYLTDTATLMVSMSLYNS